MVKRATLTRTVNIYGIDNAIKNFREFKKELKELHGAKATITINIIESRPTDKAIGTKSFFITENQLRNAVEDPLRMSPSALSPNINNHRLLQDKAKGMTAGINEILKQQYESEGKRTVIRNKDQFMKVYGRQYLEKPRFLYFKSKIGSDLNNLASRLLKDSIS